MDIRKGFKAVGKGLGAVAKGFAEGINAWAELEDKQKKEQLSRRIEKHNADIIELDGETLSRLKWMGSDQLKAVFKGKTVKIKNDPEVWSQMKWMSSDQLDAIFGDDNPV